MSERWRRGGTSGQSGDDLEVRSVGHQLDGSELIYLDNRSGFRE
jgi:hypothetical protein